MKDKTNNETKETEEKETMTIPFSLQDIEDLQNGEEFDWCFETNKGRSINIHIRQENEEDWEN